MRVGLISIWFERGQAYVTRMLREVIARERVRNTQMPLFVLEPEQGAMQL